MYSWNLITGDAPATSDARRLRQALGAFPTGVCLVTTAGHDGKREGLTVNSFASVSLAPPLLLWSVRDDTRSAAVFMSSRAFVIHVLTIEQRELALHFARPALDKFDAYEAAFDLGLEGCPRLKESVATYECTVYSRHQEGDHTILVGRVDRFSHSDHPPLMFHGGRMGSVWELAGSSERPVPQNRGEDAVQPETR